MLIPDVVDALARLKERGYMAEDDDLVFCNTAGDHLDNHAMRRRYYRAIKAAGVEAYPLPRFASPLRPAP